ncbi:MAG: hypothetical protein JSW68_07990 [Burkholderiales bacterium]|nr:MAG: hypothetical protein JSW68_07990 [Burkholderiales bacterium]
MITIGYPVLPTLGARYLDRYFDLDAGQNERATQQLEALMAWHRRHELPQLARMLRSAESEARHRPSGAEIGRWREALMARWEAMAARLAPAAAEFARGLRPEQLERLRARFEESNRKLRERYLADDPVERLAARSRRIEERAEYFFGTLSERQQAEILRRAPQQPTREEVWFDERIARQQRLLAVLERIVRERPAQATATRWLKPVLVDWWRSPDPRRQADLDRAARAADLLTAALIRSAEPAQRERLGATLSGWADDFEKLAAGGGGPVQALMQLTQFSGP